MALVDEPCALSVARGEGALLEVVEEADTSLALAAAQAEVEMDEGGKDREVVADLSAR